MKKHLLNLTSPLLPIAACAVVILGAAVPASASPAADIQLTTRQQARLQLSVQKAGAIIHHAVTALPAVLATDPAGVSIVSAPIDGQLMASPHRPFPQLLYRAKAGSPLAQIIPSLNTTELTALKLLLVKTRAHLAAVKLAAATSHTELQRDKALYKSDQAVSLQTLEDAQAAYAQATSLYSSERAVAVAVAAWLHGGKDATGIPLVSLHAGRVVKLLAHPGQEVVTGEKLFKLFNTHRLLVRIFLPVDYALPGHFRLTTLWHGHTLHLQWVGIAAHTSNTTRGAVILAKLRGAGQLRPGMPMTVWLTPQRRHVSRGFIIPQRAIVWWGGARWIFSQTSKNTFEPVRLVDSAPAPGGRFVTTLPQNARLIVVRGAQYLLSIEQSYSLKKSG